MASYLRCISGMAMGICVLRIVFVFTCPTRRRPARAISQPRNRVIYSLFRYKLIPSDRLNNIRDTLKDDLCARVYVRVLCLWPSMHMIAAWMFGHNIQCVHGAVHTDVMLRPGDPSGLAWKPSLKWQQPRAGPLARHKSRAVTMWQLTNVPIAGFEERFLVLLDNTDINPY